MVTSISMAGDCPGNDSRVYINERQWQLILLEMLGLCSGATPNDIHFTASYAMSCGVKSRIPFPSIPKDWDELLVGTISHMQDFMGYQERYLIIVSRSYAQRPANKYQFPKCMTKPTMIWASTSLNNSVDKLSEWVVESISK